MPETHLFEYSVIRIMPRVEREEFINVGVILYCPTQRFLQTLFEIDERRLCIFTEEPDVAALYERLKAFERICNGREGTIGQLPMAARFRWLTAARSTVVQTSAVHPGLCMDARQTLIKLFMQLVK